MNDAATVAHRGQRTVVGSAIAIYWFSADLLVGLPTLVLGATRQPLAAFLIGALVVLIVNVAACSWIDRQWTEWLAGSSLVADRLDRLRSGEGRAATIAAWMQRSSDLSFAVGSAITSAITATVTRRALVDEHMGRHRIWIASIAHALFLSATFALAGSLIGISPADPEAFGSVIAQLLGIDRMYQHPYHGCMKATVGERGQVTIPKAMRDRMGIGAGQEVEFHEEPGRLIVTKAAPPADPFEAVYGTLRLDDGMNTDAFIDALRGPARGAGQER
jgi:AbrB family looped-hinge helix DNA binding protein